MNKKKLNLRTLTSFFTIFGFLIMAVTGLVLYIVPEGRIAYWTHWELTGLTKTNWGNIHILSSILFIAAGIFHTYFNWKPIENYIKDRATGGLNSKRELAISSAVSVIIIFSALFSIPPLSYMIDFNEYVKDKWIVSEEYEPPYGHAEQTSFNVFVKKMSIDIDSALAELNRNNIKVANTGLPLGEIAQNNKISPMDLYMHIKKFEAVEEVSEAKIYTPEMVEMEFAGSNLGNRTIESLSRSLNIEIDNVTQKFQRAGFDIKNTETLKKVAEKYNITPIELLKVMLVEDYRLESDI